MMAANAAIYLPTDKVDLTDVFKSARGNGGLFKRATSYTVDINGDVVTFNLMPREQIPAHIQGFLGYIASLDEEAERKHDASFIVQHTKSVLGLVADREFEENHQIWASLFKIADYYDGYVFVHGSLLLPSGGVILGPLRDTTE
jgi:hypothetical protein